MMIMIVVPEQPRSIMNIPTTTGRSTRTSFEVRLRSLLFHGHPKRNLPRKNNHGGTTRQLQKFSIPKHISYRQFRKNIVSRLIISISIQISRRNQIPRGVVVLLFRRHSMTMPPIGTISFPTKYIWPK